MAKINSDTEVHSHTSSSIDEESQKLLTQISTSSDSIHNTSPSEGQNYHLGNPVTNEVVTGFKGKTSAAPYGSINDNNHPITIIIPPKNKQKRIIVCYVISVVTTLLCLISISGFLSIGLYFIVPPQPTTFSTVEIFQAPYTVYIGEVNGGPYGNIKIKSTSTHNSYDNVIIYLVKHMSVNSTNITITQTLSQGPGITTDYFYTGSQYYVDIANITGPSGSGFTVNVLRYTEEYTETVCTTHVTLNSSSSPFNHTFKCVFNKPGYYDVRYIVDEEINGEENAILTNIKLDTAQHNNIMTCNITTNDNTCILLLNHDNYHVIGDILHDHDITIEYELHGRVEYYTVPSIFLIIPILVLLISILISIYCIRKYKYINI